jgi:hypothetical protein
MTMGTGSFSWGKVAGRGIDHLPPYITEVKERVYMVAIPLLPLWAFMACSKVYFTYLILDGK